MSFMNILGGYSDRHSHVLVFIYSVMRAANEMAQINPPECRLPKTALTFSHVIEPDQISMARLPFQIIN